MNPYPINVPYVLHSIAAFLTPEDVVNLSRTSKLNRLHPKISNFGHINACFCEMHKLISDIKTTTEFDKVMGFMQKLGERLKDDPSSMKRYVGPLVEMLIEAVDRFRNVERAELFRLLFNFMAQYGTAVDKFFRHIQPQDFSEEQLIHMVKVVSKTGKPLPDTFIVALLNHYFKNAGVVRLGTKELNLIRMLGASSTTATALKQIFQLLPSEERSIAYPQLFDLLKEWGPIYAAKLARESVFRRLSPEQRSLTLDYFMKGVNLDYFMKGVKEGVPKSCDALVFLMDQIKNLEPSQRQEFHVRLLREVAERSMNATGQSMLTHLIKAWLTIEAPPNRLVIFNDILLRVKNTAPESLKLAIGLAKNIGFIPENQRQAAFNGLVGLLEKFKSNALYDEVGMAAHQTNHPKENALTVRCSR